MRNNYKKIQEKIEKAVVKHLDSVVTNTVERNSILYSNYNEYVLMTAFNHQEYFIPKDEVIDSTIIAYGQKKKQIR